MNGFVIIFKYYIREVDFKRKAGILAEEMANYGRTH
jgi:hypothetical protein